MNSSLDIDLFSVSSSITGDLAVPTPDGESIASGLSEDRKRQVNEGPDGDTPRKLRRLFVDSNRLSVLMASYSKHFSEYSNGRKNVSQALPIKVWKKVGEQAKVCP